MGASQFITTNTLESHYILSKNNKIQIRDESDNKFLLYNMSNYEPLVINSVGKTIFDLCDGENSIGEIIEFFNTTYEYPNKAGIEIQKSVEEFLLLLLLKNLVEIKNK